VCVCVCVCACVRACMRACVLYVQYVPLKVWLYREGFARLSNTRFSLETIDDTCILCTLIYYLRVRPMRYIIEQLRSSFAHDFQLQLN